MPTADRTDEPTAQSLAKLTKTTVSDCDRAIRFAGSELVRTVTLDSYPT